VEQFIYRWNVQYLGFIYNDKFFDKQSNYLGMVYEGEVWRKDGSYLGEFIDGHYILRKVGIRLN